MITPDFDAILDEAIRVTGVDRYRYLCSQDNDRPSPNSPEDWRRWITSRAWERPGQVAVDYTPAVPSAGCGGCG